LRRQLAEEEEEIERREVAHIQNDGRGTSNGVTMSGRSADQAHQPKVGNQGDRNIVELMQDADDVGREERINDPWSSQADDDINDE
jgi:hypothetical protein